MENQVTKLKLNVTNIKSYLINSNKELGKLRKDKKNLFSKLEKKRELRAEENRLETKNLGIGSGFSKVAGAITAPAKSIFDKILEFFGLIALGVLVQKLPQIIEKINQFLDSDFFKSITSLLSTLAKGIDALIDISLSSKEIEGKNAKKEKKELEEANKKITDQSKKLEKEKSRYEDILSKLGKIPMTPMAPGSMFPTPPLKKEPKPQERSTGGTITQEHKQNPTYKPPKSGPLKRAERGMTDGFTDFSLSVNNIEEAVRRDEENVIAFAKMSEKFREWSSVGITTTGKPFMPPGQNGAASSGGGGPFPKMAMIPGNGKVRGGAIITDPYDPDYQDSGMDIALSDASGNYDIGAIIQNPFSELTITDRGYQFSNGRGFGWYVTGNAIIQGKTYELLVGHLDQISVNKGDILKAGDSIGTQGMSGSTTGPHVTTHINDLSGGGDPWSVLRSVADSWQTGNIIQTDATKKQSNGMVVTIPKVTKALNTSNSSGNQSLFIYAVQPIESFVPFPYAVPIKQPSSSSIQKPKLPGIWRE